MSQPIEDPLPELTQNESNNLSDTNANIVPRNAHWSKKMSEIPIFLFFMAYAFSDTIFSNLILYRTCTNSLGYNETICSLMITSRDSNDTKELREIVQYNATNITMAKSLLSGIFPAIVSLFLGPWSDTNGRKPLLISSMLGYLIYFCITIWFSLWDNLNPWWLILPILPFSIFGGVSSLITGCFCYISDITDMNNRSYRMGVLEGLILTGYLIGSLSSSYAFNFFGYTVNFAICGVITSVGLLYSIFMEESVPPHEINKCSVFNINLVLGMLRTCFKKRSNYRRAILWLVMLSSSFGIFAQEGELSVIYFFVMEKLLWNLRDFAWFSAFSIVMTVIGITLVAIILQKWLKFPDSIVSMIAFFFSVTKCVITGLATKTWHMYFGAGIALSRGAFGPSNRSILTKTVPSEDVGKVLSLTTSLETIIPLASGPLYTLVYQKTLYTCPGAYNFISALLYGFCFILIGIVGVLKKRFPAVSYDLIRNEG